MSRIKTLHRALHRGIAHAEALRLRDLNPSPTLFLPDSFNNTYAAFVSVKVCEDLFLLFSALGASESSEPAS